MNQITNLSKEMNTMIKNEQYKQALELFIRFNRNNHIENEVLISDDYILYHVMKSFRKISKPLFGYRFITKKLKMPINIECNEYFLKSYIWTVFVLLKREEKSKELETEIINDTLMLIHELNRDFNKYHFEIVTLLFQYIIKEKEKYDTNWSLINELLDLLDRNALSKENSIRSFKKNGQDRTVENASELEKWFAEKTRALEKLELYEECINLSNEALKTVQNFHYDNDIWFKRHIAISKGNIGNKEEAIKELKIIVQIRNRWFIHHDIAKFYFDLKEYKEALFYALKASIIEESFEKKIRVFELIAKIYEKLDEKENAKTHYELVLSIRRKKGWSTDSFQITAAKYNIAIHKLTFNKTLINKMNDFWDHTLNDDKSYKKNGNIKKLFPEKKFGFITSEDKDYFFKYNSIKFPLKLLNENQNIMFDTEQSYDRKKQEKTIVAINISLNEVTNDGI